MVQGVQNSTAAYSPATQQSTQSRQATYQSFQFQAQIDVVSFSSNGVSTDQAQNIVLDRAFEKLRSVVDEARKALGIPEGEPLDTSAGATANRIADFALNFFSQYAKNNGLEDTKEGRQQFADFIGNAIGQGVDEARGILTALSALNDDNKSLIDQITQQVQSRLDDFVQNGLNPQSSPSDSAASPATTV